MKAGQPISGGRDRSMADTCDGILMTTLALGAVKWEVAPVLADFGCFRDHCSSDFAAATGQIGVMSHTRTRLYQLRRLLGRSSRQVAARSIRRLGSGSGDASLAFSRAADCARPSCRARAARRAQAQPPPPAKSNRPI